MSSINIVRAVVTNAGKDDLVRPIQQFNSLGTVLEAEVFFPYGMHANLPVNSMAILMTLMGQSSNKVAMGSMPNKRQTLKEGEVMFYHPITGAEIRFTNDGSISIKSKSESKTKFVIDKNGDVDIIGNIKMKGDLEVDGVVTGGEVKTSSGIDLDTHTHPAASPSIATTATVGASGTAGVISGNTGVAQ